jgi:hypothetical protein
MEAWRCNDRGVAMRLHDKLITIRFCGLSLFAFLLAVSSASAQNCTRNGTAVTCDDGRSGLFTGDAIIWPDGSQSRAARQSPSVIIGNNASVHVGNGVFVGNGKGGVQQFDDPMKKRCATLDGVSYCN